MYQSVEILARYMQQCGQEKDMNILFDRPCAIALINSWAREFKLESISRQEGIRALLQRERLRIVTFSHNLGRWCQHHVLLNPMFRSFLRDSRVSRMPTAGVRIKLTLVTKDAV